MAENQRIRLTRKLLRESLIQLLDAKDIHQITVKEICSGADINRTTFYKYYGGPFDLLRDIEQEVLMRIEECLAEDRSEELDLFVRMLNYFDSNAKLFRILFRNNFDPDFISRMMYLPGISGIVKTNLENTYPSDQSAYLYDFIATGGLQIIRSWLGKNMREPSEYIAGLISDLVRKIL